MNNTKLTNILLVLLLIFNVAFIGTWWMSHPKFHHPKKEIKPETTILLHDRDRGEMFLVKALNLDTAQQKKLDNILAAHYTFFDKYSNAYLRNQSDFFNALKNTPDSVTAFRSADSLGILKVAMEKELYSHFLSIRNICNSGQQKQYNQLIDNMSKEFVRHHGLIIGTKPDTNHDTL
jgi:hypothetical protein